MEVRVWMIRCAWRRYNARTFTDVAKKRHAT